jgi:hypothetical protein
MAGERSNTFARSMQLVLEVCVDSVQFCPQVCTHILSSPSRMPKRSRCYFFFSSAARGGANRLEICGNLVGGLVGGPSPGLVRTIQKPSLIYHCNDG